MNLTSVHTVDIELGLIPDLALFALHTDKGVRLIAEQKNVASFFVINSRTDEPFLLDGNDFVTYTRFILGRGEIKVLFQKQRNDLKRGRLK
jgi:hypothetical protein